MGLHDYAPEAIAARRVLIGGTFVPATIRISRGIVTDIDGFDRQAELVLDDEAVLLPGLVDSHVHLDDPGREEWEGFGTGTAAAAAGGVTTVVDMPLNSLPVTTTPEALQAKRRAAAGRISVDVGYWGGAVPGNLRSLAPLHDQGVAGVKCFLAPSGIDEFGHLDAVQLERVMAELAVFDGLLLVHAEHPQHLPEDGPLGQHYDVFERSRPPAAERAAIELVIATAARTGARAHIVHLSDGSALDLIRQAKAAGVRLTVETCPHYLTLRGEEVPDGAAQFKCCPPIRSGANQDLLWEGIVDGTIDAIVSDHSPSTPELKARGDGDFGLAWGGISGLETGLSTVWTEARKRNIPLESVVHLMSVGPARIAGLQHAGTIRIGDPAHLAVFRPELPFAVNAERLHYRHPVSPWNGQVLHGLVTETYLAGQRIYRHGTEVMAGTGREILGGRRVSSADDPFMKASERTTS
ncbi:allantoinase AllB [Psychromicrobium xiongbiense]|uniref:allantoinase AllB n=1 Tax=Psychromicrobium xiongbiense TaxID=3051184 RepID=UPI0025523E35|nr:allantoinase AllB [Psychromicrobium sp. YIM S02556]